MKRFLRSFLFFIKEHGVLCVLLRSIFIGKRTQRSAFFCKRTKRSSVLLHSLQKNVAFFYVLCKRTLRSLRSFTFFAKECCVLCVLLGLISRQKLEKRTECTELEKNAVPNPALLPPVGYCWLTLVEYW